MAAHCQRLQQVPGGTELLRLTEALAARPPAPKADPLQGVGATELLRRQLNESAAAARPEVARRIPEGVF